MVWNKLIWLSLLMLFTNLVYGQENRYVVYFTDKQNSVYNINEPLDFLSQRAITRRIDQDISVTVDDLPVNSWYLDSLRKYGADVFYTSRWFNAALVQAAPEEIDLIKNIIIVDSVEYAAPGVKLAGRIKEREETEAAETDRQNKLHNITQMHQDGYRGEGKWIAVMDGGFAGVDVIGAFQHLYTENKVIMVENLVNNNDQVYQFSDHGTKVLSLISGFDAAQYIGAAYESAVGLFVTEDVSSEYRIEEYNWLFAAEMADSAGFDIINTSLGYNTFDDPSMDYSTEDLNGSTAIITIASNFASARGILTVTSAGNTGNDDWQFITFPADALFNISVGAVDFNGIKASFSSIGPTADGRIKPDLSALGVGVNVINSAGSIVSGSGTSFSAPLVSGIAAGIWQRFSNLTMLQLRGQLFLWSTENQQPDVFTGHGILIYEFSGEKITSLDQQYSLTISPNPARDKLYIKDAPDDAEYFISDMKGITTAVSFERGMCDIRMLPAGVYLLSIRSAQGVFIHKIVKE